MSEQSTTYRSIVLTLLLLPFAAVTLLADGPQLLSMEWHGANLVFQFDQEVSFEHDLAESDSSLVLSFTTPISVEGSRTTRGNGLTGVISESGDRFTLRGDERFGYSTLWGPYSRTIVVYTFDWDELSHAEEEFHLGLLAMERGFPELAAEYLNTARNTDTGLVAKRAEGALGILHEKEGNDSLAKLYLRDPIDADGWGARAAILRRSGDTAAAATAEMKSEQHMNGTPGLAGLAEPDTDDVESGESTPMAFLNTPLGIGLLVVVGLMIILISTLFARRPAEQPAEEHHHHDPPKEDPPADLEPAVTEDVVEVEERIAPPPAPVEQAPISPPPGVPAPEVEERPKGSRQAEELRARVSARVEERQTSQADAPAESSDMSSEEVGSETTLNRARRMNVSRDYVELKERLQNRKDQG